MKTNDIDEPNNEKYSDYLNIKIEKAGFIDELVNHKKFFSLLAGIFICVIVILSGIYSVVMILRKSHQIPDIIAKSSGVVINIEPDKDVAYFLFNSSDYWASTDVTVEKGDVLSIYASGTYTTAIHHIVSSADKDVKPPFKWSSTKGYPSDLNSPRIVDRISFTESIMNGVNNGALIMKVSDNKFPKSGEDEDLYYIGEKQENIAVRTSGRLFFSVNEIYLDRNKIIKLQKKYLDNIRIVGCDSYESPFEKVWEYPNIEGKKSPNIGSIPVSECSDFVKNKDLQSLCNYILKRNLTTNSAVDAEKKERELLSNNIDSLDSIFRDLKKYKEEWKQSIINESSEKIKESKGYIVNYINSFVKHNLVINDLEGVKKDDDYKTTYSNNIDLLGRVLELERYYLMDYKTAWFDDNLGSFFIVIEKKKNKN